jgi:hypothetical protein
MVRYTEIDRGAPIADAFDQVGLGWASALVALAAVAGLTSVILVDLITMTRIGFAMGRDGLLPTSVAQVSPRTGTPLRMTLLFAAVVLAMATFVPLGTLADLVSSWPGWGPVWSSTPSTATGTPASAGPVDHGADRPPPEGRSAEQVAEEGLLLPRAVSVLRAAVRAVLGATHLLQHLTDDGPQTAGRVLVAALVVPLVVPLVVARLLGGPRAAVPVVLGIDQPIELPAVEEDPPAVRALVDVDAVAFVGTHRAVALRAAEFHARATGAPRR